MFRTPTEVSKKDKSPDKSKEKLISTPKVRQKQRSRFQSSVKKPSSGKTKSIKRSTVKPIAQAALSFDSPQEQLITEYKLRPQNRKNYSTSKLTKNINFFKSLVQPPQLDNTFVVAENLNKTRDINVEPNDISLQELDLSNTEVQSFFADININRSTQTESELVNRHSQANLPTPVFNVYTQIEINSNSIETQTDADKVNLNDSFTQTDDDLWFRIGKENDELIKSINSLDIAVDQAKKELFNKSTQVNLSNTKPNKILHTENFEDFNLDFLFHIPETKIKIQSNMAEIGLKEILIGIKPYKGEETELEAFLNRCDLYVSLTPTALQANLLLIIKANLSGEVLQKIGDVAQYADWNQLKRALRESIKPLFSFAGAQEAILANKQLKTETVRQFGARMKTLLEQINNTKHITDSVTEVKIALRKQNERQAIIKYQQNILNPELQRLLATSTLDTLDELIALAAEKEIWIKSSALMKCSICSKTHLEFECTFDEKKAKNGDSQPNSLQKKDVICSRCKKPGHFASTCYNKMFQTFSRPNSGSNNPQNNNRFNNNFQHRSNQNFNRNPSQFPNFPNQNSNQNPQSQNRNPNWSNNRGQTPNNTYSSANAAQNPNFNRNQGNQNSNYAQSSNYSQNSNYRQNQPTQSRPAYNASQNAQNKNSNVQILSETKNGQTQGHQTEDGPLLFLNQ